MSSLSSSGTISTIGSPARMTPPTVLNRRFTTIPLIGAVTEVDGIRLSERGRVTKTWGAWTAAYTTV